MKTFVGIATACMLVGVGSSVLAQGAGGSTTNGTTNSTGGSAMSGTTNSIGQWIAQMKGKRDAEFNARMAELQKKHDEMIAKRKERLAKNKRLTAAEKQDAINFSEQQYKANVDFRNTRHVEAMKFLDSLAGQADLTKDQIKDKLKAFMEQQKAENKDHRAKQKTERQAERATIKSELQQNNQASKNQTNQGITNQAPTTSGN